MELKHLRTFMAVVEAGSFTQAGKRLHLTQAAVSQHIAALERECGVSLFARAARSVSLTDAGRRLRDYATRILELVEEARLVVQGAELPVRGKLRIAASTVPAEHLLPAMLAEFRAAFPEVRESIVVSDSRMAIQAVEDGELDVGFVGEQTNSSRLVFAPIAEDEMILVVAPSHAWARKRFVAPASLAKQPLILRESGSGSRRCVEQALLEKRIELEDLQIVMEVNSNDAIRSAVEQHVGVAFLSSLTAAHDLQEGRLVRVQVRGVQAARQLFMVRHTQRSLPAAAVEFIRFVERGLAA